MRKGTFIFYGHLKVPIWMTLWPPCSEIMKFLISPPSQLNDLVISSGLDNVNKSAYKHSHSTNTVLLSVKNVVRLLLLGLKLLLWFSWTKLQHLTPLNIMPIECLISWFGVGGVRSWLIEVLPFWPLSVHQDWCCIIWCQCCMVCPRGLSWGQSYFH